MTRSRITTAAATVALLGGLGVAQLATAGSAFAYDSGADLNTVLSGGFMYDKNTGKVMGGGLGVDYGNRGPEAAKATLTVTAVKNIRFTGKPTFKGDNKGTVKSWSAKKVVIEGNLAANGDEIESVDLPANVYGKKQVLRSEVKGDKTDPDTSNNTKTGNYSVDAPDWKPGKPTEKPTTKPTEKPTAKPTEPTEPSEPSQKPTSKPTTKPSDDASEANTPAPAGGSDKGDGGKGDLAETGGNSNTPMLVGGAGALVVIGGAAVFLAKRKKAGQN